MNFRGTFLTRSAMLVYLSLVLSMMGRMGTTVWQHDLTAMSGTALTLAAIVLFLDMRAGRGRSGVRRDKL